MQNINLQPKILDKIAKQSNKAIESALGKMIAPSKVKAFQLEVQLADAQLVLKTLLAKKGMVFATSSVVVSKELDINGLALLMIPLEEVLALADILRKKKDDKKVSLSETDPSSLTETLNIVANIYVNSLVKELPESLPDTVCLDVPYVLKDKPSLSNLIDRLFLKKTGQKIFFQNELIIEGHNICLLFFLVIDSNYLTFAEVKKEETSVNIGKNKIILFASKSSIYADATMKEYKRLLAELKKLRPFTDRVVDVSNEPSLREKYKVDALPTLLIEDKRFVGKPNVEEIMKSIKQ